MKIKDVTAWETVVSVKSNANIDIHGSNNLVKNKWIILGFPYNLKGEIMFYLIEYDESKSPVTGICSYVVSKEELEENFEIVGKYK